MATQGPDLEERLRRFLASYGALLRSAVHRVCPRGVDPSDVEQEARLRVLRALERETEITDPASYLYRAAASATIDAIRRLRSRREVPLTDAGNVEARSDDESPEAAAIRRQTGRRIAEAIEALLPSRRLPVRLHLQGFSPAEVGRLLGCSESRARNLVYRGLADLREELRRRGVEP